MNSLNVFHEKLWHNKYWKLCSVHFCLPILNCSLPISQNYGKKRYAHAVLQLNFVVKLPVSSISKSLKLFIISTSESWDMTFLIIAVWKFSKLSFPVSPLSTAFIIFWSSSLVGSYPDGYISALNSGRHRLKLILTSPLCLLNRFVDIAVSEEPIIQSLERLGAVRENVLI